MRVIAFLIGLCLCCSVYADWQDTDVPDPLAIPGSAVEDPAGTWTITGSGADIWGTADQFHFLYDDAPVTDEDYAISCHVVSLDQPTNTWSKVGIMVRTGMPGTNAGSTYVSVCATTGNGACFQYRDGDGVGALDPADAGTGIRWQQPPTDIWLKLVRVGNLYSGYASIDNETWVKLGEQEMLTLVGDEDMYRGISLTSHDVAVSATAVVDNINLEDVGISFNGPTDFTCSANDDSVDLSWTNNATYSDIILKRLNKVSGEETTLTVASDASDYTDTPGQGLYEYSLSAKEADVPTEGSVCSIKVGSFGIIDASGYFLSWLVLGPLSQAGGANPGEPAIYNDYLATIDGVTEANVLPKEGDTMEIDFASAASTDVQGPTVNGQNPDALDGAADWYFYEDPDGLIDSNEIYGANYDNMMIYHVSYLINKTADTLFLEGFASSDDTAVYMLDNSVYGITYWNGYIDAAFPFIIPPGEHRLMVKLFEGGGGNGIHFRLRDPDTGLFITGSDPRIEVGLAPTMTEVPAVPTATVTRGLPDTMFLDDPVIVTLTVTDGPVTIYEKPPANMTVSNYGAGVLTNGIIKWTGVSDSVTYTVTPQSAGGTFSGAAEQTDSVWFRIGGMETTVFPEEIEGWFTYDIADSGLLTQTSTDIINNGDGSYDMTINASGHDIWDTADDFRYTWKSFPVDGIAVIQGRLDVFTRTTNDWAKAGFMFRTNLTQGSPFVIGDLSVASGVAGGSPGRNMQWRDDQDAAAAWDGNQPPHQLPDWIRVVYNQGLVTVYFAEDLGDVPEESDWVEHGSHNLNIVGVDTIYGGVAVSSHDDNALVTAEFSNVEIVEPCLPANVTRSFTWDTFINAEGAMAPVLPADGSTPLPVSLAVTDVRANGGSCPDLGDITIIETLPAGWTAENISDGGDFDDGFSTITWSIPAAQAQEKTLTYDAVGEFVDFNVLSFSGTIAETGNNFIFKIDGPDTVVSNSPLGANAEILSWLILGPFGHASVSTAPFDQTVMEADNLADGADITEESIMTDPTFFQVAGDEITPDYNGEAATTGLHPAINPDVNPNFANGTAQWIPYFDQDGLQVDLTNKGLYGTNNNAMCYGLCYLKVDEEMDVIFAAGSDDAIQVLLDGNEILIDITNHGWAGFNQFSPVQTLSPGAHVLMTKTFNGAGGWNFGVQLLQADGITPVIDGITVSLTPPGTGPTGISVFSGDANGDGAVNLADAITLLSYQFAGGDPPACMKSGDVNNDGAINLADAITLLSYQFGGGNLTAPDGGQLNSGTIGCTLYPENTVSDLGCIAQCAK